MELTTWRHAAADRLVSAYADKSLPLRNLFQLGVDAACARTMPGLAEGLIETGLKIVRDAQACGAVNFVGQARDLLSINYEIDFNMAVARGDVRRVEALLGLLVGAIEGARHAGARVSITMPPPASIKAVESDKPVRVIIEQMPTRETTTAVEYSTAGDIVSTTQVERDT